MPSKEGQGGFKYILQAKIRPRKLVNDLDEAVGASNLHVFQALRSLLSWLVVCKSIMMHMFERASKIR